MCGRPSEASSSLDDTVDHIIQVTIVHAKICNLRKCNLGIMCNIMHFSTVSKSQLKHFQLKVIWCAAMSPECRSIQSCRVLGDILGPPGSRSKTTLSVGLFPKDLIHNWSRYILTIGIITTGIVNTKYQENMILYLLAQTKLKVDVRG